MKKENIMLSLRKATKTMKGIHYLTDENNNRIAVQIDLRKYGELWEDFYDHLVAEMRKGEEKIPLEELMTQLKKKDQLDADL